MGEVRIMNLHTHTHTDRTVRQGKTMDHPRFGYGPPFRFRKLMHATTSVRSYPHWKLILASKPRLTLNSATTIVSVQVGTLTHSS